MEWILQWLVWGAAFSLLYTYLIYPSVLEILKFGKQTYPDTHFEQDQKTAEFRVSMLISAYNEEKVLAAKLDSLLNLKPFGGVLRVYLGSDASEDGTDTLALAFQAQHPWFSFIRFSERTGKPGIINHLARLAIAEGGNESEHIFVITDADILFDPELLRQLLRHFVHPGIAVVDSHIHSSGESSRGISKAERRYLSGEAKLKFLEGILWGAMIGPFGGCYAIRAGYFKPVPEGFLVDDFFITLSAIQTGGMAISDPRAIVWEKTNDSWAVEWKRKRRIGAGNYQNMRYFRGLWWPPLTGVGFAFFSHKILRWIGPHTMLVGFISSGLLGLMGNQIYAYLFLSAIGGLVGVFLLDALCRCLSVQLLPLRGLRYFFSMNAALFSGWLYYLKGIKSNVWERTKRAS